MLTICKNFSCKKYIIYCTQSQINDQKMYNCLTGYKSINERKKIPKKKMRKVQNSENACLLET